MPTTITSKRASTRSPEDNDELNELNDRGHDHEPMNRNELNDPDHAHEL